MHLALVDDHVPFSLQFLFLVLSLQHHNQFPYRQVESNSSGPTTFLLIFWDLRKVSHFCRIWSLNFISPLSANHSQNLVEILCQSVQSALPLLGRPPFPRPAHFTHDTRTRFRHQTIHTSACCCLLVSFCFLRENVTELSNCPVQGYLALKIHVSFLWEDEHPRFRYLDLKYNNSRQSKVS